MMPASSSRPKRKSRGDAYLEDNGIGMGGGGGRKEKENSAPAAKKRREEDKQSSKSTAATTTTNAPATRSSATATKPKVGSLFYITHPFFYNLLRQLAKGGGGGGGEDCSYQELLSLLSLKELLSWIWADYVLQKKKKAAAPEMRLDDGFAYRVRTTRSSTAAAAAAAGQESTQSIVSSSHDTVPIAPPPDPPRQRVKKKRVMVSPPPGEVGSKPKVAKATKGDAILLSQNGVEDAEEEMEEGEGGKRKKKEATPKASKVSKERKPAPEERRPKVTASSTPRLPKSQIPTAVGGGHGPNDGTKVVLPVSNTPIIRRNQQLRQKGQGNRRSSVGMRGRRASSLMDNGVVGMTLRIILPTEPHAEVETEEFYKHIADELLEPQRMKQLLSWCGKRALSHQPSPPTAGVDGNARAVARIIEEEVLKDLLSNAELSSWFNRDDSQAPTVAKKPNPRNLDNLAKVEECEANLKKLREERETWGSLLRPETQSTLSISGGKSDVRLFEKSLLRPEESEFANSLAKSQDLLGSAKRLVKQQCGEIEFQVDQLIDGIHKLNQYGEAADRLGGRILEDAESTLAVREATLRQASGTEALPIQEVLRSLSRMDR
ncbi:Mis12-Mtw1 protein family-domain-containing protein [Tuber borchii]|uniref:Mis12-Mtw1 protein family-domain-containing protein n=1 Tax=Tuber borchii TaxID=42251 RepID=A0A2T6ZSI7_TUBBO|nr:Mis12-Mtw1 protein family-domain-containing protein [Tuber borchii]